MNMRTRLEVQMRTRTEAHKTGSAHRRSTVCMGFVITFVFAILSPAAASSREWTAAQNDVLEVVEAYTEASHRRDLEAYLSYWHPEFLGWHNGDAAPTNKEERRRGLERYFATWKSVQYELEPLGVQLLANGEAAIVHFVLRNVLESGDGTRVVGVSHWTDCLTREQGRWLLISDHGGSVSE